MVNLFIDFLNFTFFFSLATRHSEFFLFNTLTFWMFSSISQHLDFLLIFWQSNFFSQFSSISRYFYFIFVNFFSIFWMLGFFPLISRLSQFLKSFFVNFSTFVLFYFFLSLQFLDFLNFLFNFSTFSLFFCRFFRYSDYCVFR